MPRSLFYAFLGSMLLGLALQHSTPAQAPPQADNIVPLSASIESLNTKIPLPDNSQGKECDICIPFGLEQIRLSEQSDNTIVHLLIGQQAAITASVGEIKKLAQLDRTQWEMELKKLLDQATLREKASREAKQSKEASDNTTAPRSGLRAELELQPSYITRAFVGGVRVGERATGKEVQKLTGHKGVVTSVAVTPDGRYIVSGSFDQTVRVWERDTGKEVQKLTGHEGVVLSVAVTPDGRYIVSGSADQTVRVWERDTGKEVQKLTGHHNWVRSVAVTPYGRYFVSGIYDKTVRVWSIDKLK
jgi:WD40 repeat protein